MKKYIPLNIFSFIFNIILLNRKIKFEKIDHNTNNGKLTFVIIVMFVDIKLIIHFAIQQVQHFIQKIESIQIISILFI